MDLPQKRKRTARIKVEANDSDCDEIISSDNDVDYMPSAKKKKAQPKPPKKEPKQPKVKKEAKPKAVRKKAVSRVAKKALKSEENSVENNKNKILVKEEIPAADNDNNVSGPSVSHPTVSDIEIERIVSTAVAQAKKSCQPWRDAEVVAETSHISIDIAENVITLLKQDCTIPFIVRYRKAMTGGLQAEKLREIQESYDEVKQVHKKVENILKTIKHEKFDESIATSFLCAKSLDEVELLYAPFKPGGKRTLAERSKELGLEPVASQLLENKISLIHVNLSSLIKPQKGLQTEQEITSGIQHIIADKISKDRRVLDFIREKIHHPQIHILSSKTASAEKEDKAAFVEGKTTQNFKYENYYQLDYSIKQVAPHQVIPTLQMEFESIELFKTILRVLYWSATSILVMALNRGEKQKVLKVKIQIPFSVKNEITNFIWQSFFSGMYLEKSTTDFMKNCVDDSYDRLIEPYMSRQIRSELSKKAEKESINVFGSNVRSLLLTPPVRGKTVVGIDPGFSHGCKVATVSSKGEVLGTDVIYPHSKSKHYNKMTDAEKLGSMVKSFSAEMIAIGNGTACRETEVWLSDLIKSNYFYPLRVKYCIVNENGASIYSVTKEAETELPGMDPNLRSAVSIARRLQDPLLEYVKIEPKHLGVGMYQHDVSESQLKKALDGIVEECVSFVGVDLNVCPENLLRKISGLSAGRAKQIVEWRNQNLCFVNRQQLLEVKGLGQKSFEQCAGFVKILPETCTSVNSSTSGCQTKKKSKAEFSLDPLDRTIIHPESYDIARKFLQELQMSPQDVGQQTLVDKVNRNMNFTSVENVASRFSVPTAVMQLIIDAFKQLQDYDIRKEFDQPLFRTSIQTFSDLKVKQELTGRVNNVTGFGAFVDAGVGTNGLIHISKMKGKKLNVGDRVTVRVLQIDAQKKRLGLELIS